MYSNLNFDFAPFKEVLYMNSKRLISLVLCMLFIFSATTCFADDAITPYAEVGTNLIMGLSISGNTVQAYAQCTPNPPRVATVSIRIEKYINGGWSVVCRNAGPDQTSTSCTYVPGVKYRAYATCTVYENGKQVDSASKYSAVKP